jgi:C4-type Zn-finger protein
MTKKVKEPGYKICPVCKTKMKHTGELKIPEPLSKKKITVQTYYCSMCHYKTIDHKKYKSL